MDKAIALNLDEFFNAVNLDMFVHENRVATFIGKWRYEKEEGASCTVEKMAKAGFYCTGKGRASDSAKCYICQHELLWDPQDDPWDEHKKHRGDCELVRIGKQSDEEFTVNEIIRLMAYVYSTRQYRHVDETKEDFGLLMDRLVLNIEKIVGS